MKKIPDIFYRSVFQSAPLGIAVSDGQGFVVDANEYLLELGGWNREELDGMAASDFYVDGPEVRRKVIDSMRNQGSLENYGIRFKRKNGTTFLAAMSLKPMVHEGEHFVIAVIKRLEV